MTVSVFPGFMHASCRCPYCGHRWEGVAAVGMMGITCPSCSASDSNHVWLPDDADRPDMPHDGCWLTGALPVIWFPPPLPTRAQWSAPWWARGWWGYVVRWWLRRGRQERSC